MQAVIFIFTSNKLNILVAILVESQEWLIRNFANLYLLLQDIYPIYSLPSSHSRTPPPTQFPKGRGVSSEKRLV
jgi:hypothetical protein